VTRRCRNVWIIDFGVRTEMSTACLYEKAFAYLCEHSKGKRETSRSKIRAWWLHERPRVEMRDALRPLPRFVATPTVSKHRLFIWSEAPTLPDHQLIALARSDDLFFGVLHSRLHEVWARALGTQVRERESGFRYTPTTCFETFPIPQPTDAQRPAITSAAAHLENLRSYWLNPPEWVRKEILEFPGSIDGPWARYVHDPDERGIGTVRYPRMVARDAHVFDLAKRTLTNLYNERPTWLDLAHKALDEAVFDAYGWDPSMTDEQILAALLELNLERSATSDTATINTEIESEVEEEETE